MTQKMMHFFSLPVTASLITVVIHRKRYIVILQQLLKP
uniref:Uncharacterized protein n=1 Tax=Anguilla anguilla TaxID=7936 RepID=A0A0E9P9F8_ANGAN